MIRTINNGFNPKEYVFEEVLVDFKCDWSKLLKII